MEVLPAACALRRLTALCPLGLSPLDKVARLGLLGPAGPGSPSEVAFTWGDGPGEGGDGGGDGDGASAGEIDLKSWLDRVQRGFGDKFETPFIQFGLVSPGKLLNLSVHHTSYHPFAHHSHHTHSR